MKVINVNQSDEVLGGSDVYFHSLSQLLTDSGVGVHEFYSSSDDGYPEKVNFEAPSVSGLVRFIYNKQAARCISEHIESFMPDLAHLHIYYGKVSSSILPILKNADIPIVQTLHEYKVVCPVYTMFREGRVCYECSGGRYYKALVNKCNRKSISRSLLSTVEQYVARANGSVDAIDKFIAVSHFQKRLLVEMGLDENRISVVHNFINAETVFPEKFRGEYFLYFGRVEEVKGIAVLLESLLYLKRNCGIDMPMVIAGAGAYEALAKEYCKENGLLNVQFLGFCNKSKVLELLGGCIASVVPSVWPETFGLTVVESMASERACIVSNIGGMPEIVTDGVDGYIVEPGDMLDLVEKLSYLFSNLGVAERMGAAGRAAVLKNFTPSVHLGQIKEVYRQVLR